MTVKDPLIDSVTSKSKWVIVLRSFDGNDVTFMRGEVDDSTDSKHKNALVSRRYIAPLPFGSEVPEEVLQEDGTMRRVVQTPVVDKKETKKAKVSNKSA